MTKTTVTLGLQLPTGDIDVEVTITGSVEPADPSVGWPGGVGDLAITKVEGSGPNDVRGLEDYLADVIWEAGNSEAVIAQDAANDAKIDQMRGK